MRFQTILLPALLALSATATPLAPRQLGICSTTLNTPLCCDVDVLGVADLDCVTPSPVPFDIPNFIDICASVGKIASCCLLPVAGQALICSAVTD